MSLPVKKIYVDSRMKTIDSNSDSDFKFELSQSLTLPKNTTCFIDDITIPHSWYNVDVTNNRLYVYANRGTDSIYAILYLNVGNYNGLTLVGELNRVFNTIGSYFLSANFDLNTNRLNIYTGSSDTSFRIFSDFELNDMAKNGGWRGENYTYNNICSINDLIHNTKKITPGYNRGTSYWSEFINFNGIRNLYLCSPNLCSLSVLGPNGSPSNIVKKIPVTSDYGFNIFAGGSIAHDYIECSKQTWRTLEFQLQDVFGNNIDLNNNPISFSIILSTINEDM
jgi:hypothetical protein